MIRLALISVCLLALTACARVVDSDFRADGTQQHRIACGYGVAGSICAAKAKEICPDGYDVKMITTHVDGDRMVIVCPAQQPGVIARSADPQSPSSQ